MSYYVPGVVIIVIDLILHLSVVDKLDTTSVHGLYLDNATLS